MCLHLEELNLKVVVREEMGDREEGDGGEDEGDGEEIDVEIISGEGKVVRMGVL